MDHIRQVKEDGEIYLFPKTVYDAIIGFRYNVSRMVAACKDREPNKNEIRQTVNICASIYYLIHEANHYNPTEPEKEILREVALMGWYKIKDQEKQNIFRLMRTKKRERRAVSRYIKLDKILQQMAAIMKHDYINPN